MAFVKTDLIEKGDLLRVRRAAGYCHFGIASSENTVIHFTDDNSDSILNSKGVMVRETPLERFLRGDQLEVEVPYSSDFPRDIVVLRAKEFLGQKVVLGNTYNLITNNCEHFARYCYSDEHSSKQVEAVSDLAAEIFTSIGAAIASTKMTKVDNKKDEEK